MTFVLQNLAGQKMYESDPDQYFECYDDFIQYLALKNVNFKHALFPLPLYCISFQGCNLQSAKFRASITSCNFNGADLCEAYFTNCVFLRGYRDGRGGGYPSFSGARLKDTYFINCNFVSDKSLVEYITSEKERPIHETNVDMSETDLTNTRFINCKGTGLIFPKVTNCIID